MIIIITIACLVVMVITPTLLVKKLKIPSFRKEQESNVIVMFQVQVQVKIKTWIFL